MRRHLLDSLTNIGWIRLRRALGGLAHQGLDQSHPETFTGVLTVMPDKTINAVVNKGYGLDVIPYY